MFQKVSEAGIPARLATLSDRVAIALPADVSTTVGGFLKQGQEITIKSSARNSARTLVQRAVVLSAPEKNRSGGALVIAVTPTEADLIFGAKSNNEQLACELLPPGRG